MRAHEPEQTSSDHERRQNLPRARGGPAGPTQGPAALQATVGNAAVVQMMRRAGRAEADASAVQRRSTVSDVLRRPGRPLDATRRAEMERRLGHDFSDVRIHTDSAARASAAEIGARAYTSGSHVVIGEGGGDKHTLAHELTHVVQQRSGPVSGTTTGQGFSVSDPGDRFERAAEANARKAMAGPAPEVQRQAEDAAPAAADTDMVQRTSTTQLETATLSHYAPTSGGEAESDLTIERPKRVTGKIAPVKTTGRKQAPEPIAVTSLVTAYRQKSGGSGGPDKKAIWKDLFGGAGYDRGHVMGLEVGGTDVDKNIVPQWSLNQGTGMWRQMEKKMVGLKRGDLRFDVEYGTSSGNHRRVMVPEKIKITLNNALYDTWNNRPDINDLIRSGEDPSDPARFYAWAKKKWGARTTLDAKEMDTFALQALAIDKATHLWHQEYVQARAAGKTPLTSSADTLAAAMTRSDIPKDRRTKLIKAYIDAGWVTEDDTGGAVVYTLEDVSESEFDDASMPDSSPDVEMSDGSSPSDPQSDPEGPKFMEIDFGSQSDSDDETYEDPDAMRM
ncbi:DUF4157 domain-containing protein [Streptomyces sp. NPDC021020]|uniref:eCIS core domain-containing protein n=1 Tax=Streptomyces sp. NPDC021020 TaxID=3365109 RepID=UPI0037B1221B